MHGLNFENGRHCFTRAAGTAAAWHRLGGETPADASIDVWMQNAGMDFTILKRTSECVLADGTRVRAETENSQGEKVDQHSLLVHSRSHKVLDQVGSSYVVHQPREIAETFRHLCATNGFTMDTMGVLDGGRRYWGLASNTAYDKIGRNKDDVIKPYLLLASGCGMATTGQLTTVRVVCQNTLHMSLSSKNDTAVVKQRHTGVYSMRQMAAGLGVEEAFEVHMDTLNRMAVEKVEPRFVTNLCLDLFATPDQRKQNGDDLEAYPTRTINNVQKIYSLFNGDARGSFPDQRGTKIQLLNSITEFVDHHQSRKGRAGSDRDSKATNAIFFGAGAKAKKEAFERLAIAA
jgi:phage/plasmid-like protein (TIGR03299 family)